MTAGGRRLRRWLVALSLLDVGTTAAVFSIVGPQVEGNPLVRLLVPLVGAYGALALILVAAKLPLSHLGGVLVSRMSGRRAAAFSVIALLPLSLVVVNNTAALVILGRMS